MENGPGKETKDASQQEEPVISLRPGGFGFGFGFGLGFKSAQAPTEKTKQQKAPPTDAVPLMPSLTPKPESHMSFLSTPKLSKTEMDIETPDSFLTVEEKQIYNRQFLLRFQENVEVPEGLETILEEYPELQMQKPSSERAPKEHVARQLRTTKPATGGAPIEKGTHSQSGLPRRATNRWEPHPSFAKDERTEVISSVTGTLNRITPEKFEQLTAELCHVIGGISDQGIYTESVGLVFRKAVQEPNFSKMYAELCVRLNNQPVPLLDSKVTFRKVLLNKCQEEFESTYQSVMNNLPKDPEAQLTMKEKARSRKLGNVKFIGELFKSRLVTEKIIHECIRILLNSISIDKGEQEIVENHCELLCKLMTTIGKLIDTPKSRQDMDAYFTRFKQLSQDHRLSSRIRFMIQDLLEMRENNWVPRHEENTPKTIEEVQADTLAKEFQDLYMPGMQHTEAQQKQQQASTSEFTKKEKKKQKKKKKSGKESTKKLTQEELEGKTTLLLKDFLDTGDVQEALQGIKELGAPHFSSKIVERAISAIVEQPKERDSMANLFVAIATENLISEEDFMRGFRAVIDALEDIELDFPQAADTIGKLLGQATVGNCLSLSLAERVKEEKVKKPMMSVIQSST